MVYKGCPDDSVQKKTYILQENIMNSASNIDRFEVLKNQLSIESLRFQSESLSF